MTAEDGMLALGRRMLLIENFAAPAAIRRCIGTEIVKKRVATENAAVIEQHHTAKATDQTIEHLQMDRVKAIADAAVADDTGRRQRMLLQRGHHRMDRGVRKLR